MSKHDEENPKKNNKKKKKKNNNFETLRTATFVSRSKIHGIRADETLLAARGTSSSF